MQKRKPATVCHLVFLCREKERREPTTVGDVQSTPGAVDERQGAADVTETDGSVKGRVTGDVPPVRVDVVAPQKEPRRRRVTATAGEHQRRVGGAVRLVGVGTGGQQLVDANLRPVGSVRSCLTVVISS